MEAIARSRDKYRLTTSLIRVLFTWCKRLPWEQVARLYDVNRSFVATAVKKAVAYGVAHLEMGSVLYIGFDELSRRKGHVDVTNVYILKERRLVWSGEGRSTETLASFVREHKEPRKASGNTVSWDKRNPYLRMNRKAGRYRSCLSRPDDDNLGNS